MIRDNALSVYDPGELSRPIVPIEDAKAEFDRVVRESPVRQAARRREVERLRARRERPKR